MKSKLTLHGARKCLPYLAVSLLAFAQTAIADGPQDFYFQNALARHNYSIQNARTFGMAGSSVATSRDSSSVVGNPAGLGLMTHADMSLSYSHNAISGEEAGLYNNVEIDENIGSALFALPIGPTKDDLSLYGNLGFGWSGYDGESDQTLGHETSGSNIYGAYAKALNNNWAIGYGLAFLDDEFKNSLYSFETDSKFRHTIGVQGNLENDLTLGVSTFIGHGDHETKIAGQTFEGDARQVGIDAGLGWQVQPETLVAFSTGYSHYDSEGSLKQGPAVFGGDEDGNVFYAAVGVEQAVNENVALRAGYRYGGLNDYDFEDREGLGLGGSAKYNAWTAGLGLTLPIDNTYVRAVKLDYGAEYRAGAGDDWQHVVTASLPFNTCY